MKSKKNWVLISLVVIAAGVLFYFGILNAMLSNAGMDCTIADSKHLSCDLSAGSIALGVLTDIKEQGIFHDDTALTQEKLKSYPVYSTITSKTSCYSTSKPITYSVSAGSQMQWCATSDQVNRYTSNSSLANSCMSNICDGTSYGKEGNCELYQRANSFTWDAWKYRTDASKRNQYLEEQQAKCASIGGSGSYTTKSYNGRQVPYLFTCNFVSKCGGQYIYLDAPITMAYNPPSTTSRWVTSGRVSHLTPTPVSAYYVLDYSKILEAKPFDNYTCLFTDNIEYNDKIFALKTNGYTELVKESNGWNLICHFVINNTRILQDSITTDHQDVITVDLSSKYTGNDCTIDNIQCSKWNLKCSDIERQCGGECDLCPPKCLDEIKKCGGECTPCPQIEIPKDNESAQPIDDIVNTVKEKINFTKVLIIASLAIGLYLIVRIIIIFIKRKR